MERDLSQVEDARDYTSIPPGTYGVRIGEVRVGSTREGVERWGLRLDVVDGDYAGRTAGWDGISWGERGLTRAKYVLSQLGFETDGVVTLEPADLEGRCAVVSLQREEREDPATGQRLVRLKVPFLGWERAEVLSAESEQHNGALLDSSPLC